MPDTITGVQPPLKFIPPAYNPAVRWALDRLLPVVIQQRTALRQIDTQNVETLVDLYRQFQEGRSRFLLAFRHPSADDPLCLAHLLTRQVPKVARQQGKSLQNPVHAHFLYDRGIPLWAGSVMTWIYPRLGGIPIHRGKIDLMALRCARDVFANGAFPLMAAPEGATNGHNEIISPLEPGISQLSFWCVEDLLKAERTEQVYILPVGIRYAYITPPWEALERILTGLEADTGMPSLAIADSHRLNEALLYQRLYRLGEHLLTVMENHYRRFFRKDLPVSPMNPSTPLSNEAFAARLSALLNAALQVAEDYFNLQPKGSVIDRCRRLEQAGWDCIYRDDLKLETISPLERGLADRVAEEADLRVWHMRLVESFVAVTGQYVQEKRTVERFAETTLLAWDMVCRIKGGNPFDRPKLGVQKVLVTVGEPLSVSDRWKTYQGGRKNAKQAVEILTKDLQAAMEAMI